MLIYNSALKEGKGCLPSVSPSILYNGVRMKKFKVLVKGNNYKSVVGSRTQEFGFHATRFVEAIDYASAEMKALELVVGELDQIVFNNPAGSPGIEVPQLVEVESFENFDVPGSGFTWHMEEKEQCL